MWVRPHYVSLVDSVYTLLSCFFVLVLVWFCFFKRIYIPMQFWVLCNVMNYLEVDITVQQIIIGSYKYCSVPFYFYLLQKYCYLSGNFYASKCTKMFELSTWWLHTLLYWFIYFILLGYNNHKSFLNGLSKVQY